MLLANFEQELNNSALKEASLTSLTLTTLKRSCLDLVSKLEELLVSDHDVDEQIQVSQVT